MSATLVAHKLVDSLFLPFFPSPPIPHNLLPHFHQAAISPNFSSPCVWGWVCVCVLWLLLSHFYKKSLPPPHSLHCSSRPPLPPLLSGCLLYNFLSVCLFPPPFRSMLHPCPGYHAILFCCPLSPFSQFPTPSYSESCRPIFHSCHLILLARLGCSIGSTSLCSQVCFGSVSPCTA